MGVVARYVHAVCYLRVDKQTTSSCLWRGRTHPEPVVVASPLSLCFCPVVVGRSPPFAYSTQRSWRLHLTPREKCRLSSTTVRNEHSVRGVSTGRYTTQPVARCKTTTGTMTGQRKSVARVLPKNHKQCRGGSGCVVSSLGYRLKARLVSPPFSLTICKWLVVVEMWRWSTLKCSAPDRRTFWIATL